MIILHASSQDLGLLYTYNSPHLILREAESSQDEQQSRNNKVILHRQKFEKEKKALS